MSHLKEETRVCVVWADDRRRDTINQIAYMCVRVRASCQMALIVAFREPAMPFALSPPDCMHCYTDFRHLPSKYIDNVTISKT